MRRSDQLLTSFFLTENVAESVTGNEDRLLFAETERIRAALFPELTHKKGDDGWLRRD